jgi:CheY-like chemotaxis protein
MDTARTILLVDDDPTLRTVFAAVLNRAGYLVLSADSAEEALQLLTSNPAIAAIITDLHMPKMNGSALLNEIVARGIRIPSIIVSGELEELYATVPSLTTVLTKPITGATLLETLERVLKQKH